MQDQINGLTIGTRVGDIADVVADAIVNPANTALIMGGGVAGALLRAGGPSVQQSVQTDRPVRLGSATVGHAGALRASWVIHAATITMDPHTLGVSTSAIIHNATQNSLLAATSKNCRSIAFPALGAGVGIVPIGECLTAMFDEFVRHSMSRTMPTHISLVLHSMADLAVADGIFRDWLRAIHCTCGAESLTGQRSGVAPKPHKYWCPTQTQAVAHG